MRLKQYLTEGKKLNNPLIGYGFNINNIKNIKDYLESELIQENIKYGQPDEYHISIAQIQGSYEKDELVRITNSLDIDFSLTPVDIKILKGKKIPKDFIVIEYKPNIKFVDTFNDISKKVKTIKFNKILPHISLLMVKRNSISKELFKSLRESMPKLKKIKTTEIQLWNVKHEKEYIMEK